MGRLSGDDPSVLPPELTQRLAELQEPFETQFSERHLHCVWYDPRLRPTGLRSQPGEAVRVLHPGEWNLEAGPDFLNASLEIGGRRIHGDVEIHIRPSDWRHHGHDHDPAYGNVRLHVSYYSGVLPEEVLPAGCVQLALAPSLDQREGFFFDAIDCRAYPWEIAGTPHPLQGQLLRQPEEARIALLEEAGLRRLQLKAGRMATRIGTAGADQALYSTILRALGYKRNGAVMELLAERLPVLELRREAGGDPLTAYALLLGVAGLLPDDSGSTTRSLWTRWWKREEGFSSRALPRSIWRLDAMRPANHPRRRLWAAAVWFSTTPGLEQQLLHGPTGKLKELLQLLNCPDCPLDGEGERWSRIGKQRKGSLVVNAIVPFLLALGVHRPNLEFLRDLPAEAVNARVRKMASSLFGPDHHPRVYRSTLCKQGLLQFYEDYGG